MRARSIAEIYAALILLLAGIALGTILYTYFMHAMPKPEPPRPVHVVDVNETHVVCYTPVEINLTYWHEVGLFQCWIVPDINSSTLEPCPTILPADTYILVTPPWLCK